MKAPLGILTITLLAVSAGLQAQSFVYTNDDVSGTNTVSIFSFTAGALSLVGSVPTGDSGASGGFYAVNRITTAGNFLYASNDGGGSISAFSIVPSTGALTLIGSPFVTGAGFGDISLAASPNGQFLFAGLPNHSVAVLAIAAGGSLSLASTASLASQPAGMKVSADGQHLAVALPASSSIAMFNIGSNGALTMVNGFAVPGTGMVMGVDINCASTDLFGGLMAQSPTMVDAYTITSTGWLTRVQGSPFSPGVGLNSNVVLLSPNDQSLFVTNQGSASLTVFHANSDGTLALVAGQQPFALPGSPSGAPAGVPAGMATDQSGSVLFVATTALNQNQIQVMNIASDGTLSPAGAPVNGNSQGSLLSLAAYPAKTCAAPPSGGPPPPGGNPPPPPPVTPPPSAGPLAVTIDIRPDGDDGKNDNGKQPAPVINPKSDGKIQVAILSSKTFNAPVQVNMNSLTFGHSGAEKSLAYCDTHRGDINHDGMADLVCSFNTAKTNFQNGDTMGILDGTMMDGTPIQGTESIRIAH